MKRTANTMKKKSAFSISNIRLFMAFRVFFNARFYYPVFTVLFLDFGLTLEQFAMLNVAWAAAIVILEVPSGALADTFGRRPLLISAGVLMVVEMTLVCFVPMGDTTVLFAVFLVNRILSGAAEAAASGADEALAYDTLMQEGDINDWGDVLERQMRHQSFAFIGAMTIGAAVYDPVLIQNVTDWLGLTVTVNQAVTIRFPLFLTLIMAIFALVTALRMQEVGTIGGGSMTSLRNSCGRSIVKAIRMTLRTGKWILKTPFALVIIASGMVFDNIVRVVLTINSQYYRLIEFPEATFGLIGSGLASLGLLVPKIARRLTARHTPSFNLGLLGVLTLIGLVGMSLFLPYWGLGPVIMLYSVVFLMGFFLSHYLNRITDSEHRATVLSFKGLSFNLAYGFVGIMYSLLLSFVRSQVTMVRPNLVGEALENVVFIRSLYWFPGYFVVTFLLLAIFAKWKLRNSTEHRKIG